MAARMEAASKPPHASQSSQSKLPLTVQQLRHTHILSLKVCCLISMLPAEGVLAFCHQANAALWGCEISALHGMIPIGSPYDFAGLTSGQLQIPCRS